MVGQWLFSLRIMTKTDSSDSEVSGSEWQRAWVNPVPFHEVIRSLSTIIIMIFSLHYCVSIIFYTDVELLHFSLDDVGVYLSNPIDSVRSHDAQVCHVYPLASIFFNKRHFPQFVHVFWKESRDPLWWQSRPIRYQVQRRYAESIKTIFLILARTSRWIWLIR